MDTSALRPRSAIIIAICSLIALTGLLVLPSDPNRVDRNPQDSARQAQTAAASPAIRPAINIPDNSATAKGAGDASPSRFSDPLQHDAPQYPPMTPLDEVIWQAQQYNSRYHRFEAISVLGDSHEAMAELTLLDLLYDQDPVIRESAVESLATLGSNRAVQGLSFALSDENQNVRRAAVEFLAEMGTPDAIDALAVTLSDPDAEMRLAVVYALADSESEAALNLMQQFLADADPSVRKVAAEFLND